MEENNNNSEQDGEKRMTPRSFFVSTIKLFGLECTEINILEDSPDRIQLNCVLPQDKGNIPVEGSLTIFRRTPDFIVTDFISLYKEFRLEQDGKGRAVLHVTAVTRRALDDLLAKKKDKELRQSISPNPSLLVKSIDDLDDEERFRSLTQKYNELPLSRSIDFQPGQKEALIEDFMAVYFSNMADLYDEFLWRLVEMTLLERRQSADCLSDRVWQRAIDFFKNVNNFPAKLPAGSSRLNAEKILDGLRNLGHAYLDFNDAYTKKLYDSIDYFGEKLEIDLKALRQSFISEFHQAKFIGSEELEKKCLALLCEIFAAGFIEKDLRS